MCRIISRIIYSARSFVRECPDELFDPINIYIYMDAHINVYIWNCILTHRRNISRGGSRSLNLQIWEHKKSAKHFFFSLSLLEIFSLWQKVCLPFKFCFNYLLNKAIRWFVNFCFSVIPYKSIWRVINSLEKDLKRIQYCRSFVHLKARIFAGSEGLGLVALIASINETSQY